MTDKEFKATRKRIRRIARKWIERLGLGWWKIDLEYSRDGSLIQSGTPEDQSQSWVSLAQARVKWQYAQATILFNMPQVQHLSDGDMESHILHELCHVLVAEMREWAPDCIPEERHGMGMKHEERVVVGLTKAFGWVHDYAYREGKKASSKQPKKVDKRAITMRRTTG